MIREKHTSLSCLVQERQKTKQCLRAQFTCHSVHGRRAVPAVIEAGFHAVVFSGQLIIEELRWSGRAHLQQGEGLTVYCIALAGDRTSCRHDDGVEVPWHQSSTKLTQDLVELAIFGVPYEDTFRRYTHY